LAHGFVTTAYAKFEPTFRRADWQPGVLAQTKAAPNVTRVTHRWLQLPAGHALELRYRWRLFLGGASYDLAVTQYAVLARGAACSLVFWTTPTQGASYRPVFERSATTLRISP